MRACHWGWVNNSSVRIGWKKPKLRITTAVNAPAMMTPGRHVRRPSPMSLPRTSAMAITVNGMMRIA